MSPLFSQLLSLLSSPLKRCRKANPLPRGQWAERQAESFLVGHGLKILERNYTVKSGEIDLIATDKHSLVFVEVRYRHSDTFGSSAESVDASKQKKLRRAAEHYLQKHNLNERQPCRFDIVALSASSNTNSNIDWIRNAF